jgi:molecular chaperone IbpA
MFDLTPLYRSTIGFDRMARLIDDLAKLDAPGYPPYNIELVDENDYRITMAVAGFSEADLSIEVKESTLTVAGRKPAEAEERKFLHQGIAARSFERRFQLADHVQVTGAELENGLLHISLKRELPEAMKPRTIAISTPGGKAKVIENKKAA